MTTTKLIEYRITRQLLQRRNGHGERDDVNPWADRLIAILAVTAGLFVLGSYLEELLWAVLGAATIFTLR
jgi:hypothetical protein